LTELSDKQSVVVVVHELASLPGIQIKLSVKAREDVSTGYHVVIASVSHPTLKAAAPIETTRRGHRTPEPLAGARFHSAEMVTSPFACGVKRNDQAARRLQGVSFRERITGQKTVTTGTFARAVALPQTGSPAAVNPVSGRRLNV
jgi:hypothetical protein